VNQKQGPQIRRREDVHTIDATKKQQAQQTTTAATELFGCLDWGKNW